MARTNWVKFILGGSVPVLALALGILTAPAAHAASATRVKTSPCHNTSVVLHGNQPPTISCADATAPTTKSSSGLQPSVIHTGDCSSASLWLYWDASLSGARLCVRGAGQLDLSLIDNCNFPLGLCQNWAGQVSSYFSGCSAGRLSQVNTNVYQDFSAWERVTYVGSSFNDTFRYAKLYSNC